MVMDEIPVSKFKAHCAEVLDEVARTGKTVTITKRGRAIAAVRPPAPVKGAKRKLGYMAGRLGIVGDIVGPIGALDPAETLREWDELNAAPRRAKRGKVRRGSAA